MIGKRIAQDRAKPKAGSIRDLTNYVTAPGLDEKILAAGGRGFVCDNFPEQQAEMIALAHEAVRSKNPVTHYVISWHSDEHPSREQVEEAISIYMATLGLSGHQVIWGLHQDTDNIHLHLAVNRVHPETGKVVEINKGFDKNAIHQAIAKIEHAQGWRPERNGRYMVDEKGKVVRRKKQKTDEKNPPGISQPAADMEHRTGEKSAERRAQEEAAKILESAKSWAEVHEQLAAKDMRYERQGSGAIVWVGDQPVKASKVSRKGSIARMQDRLGPFEAAGATPNVYFEHRPKEKERYFSDTRPYSQHGMRQLSECRVASSEEGRKKRSRVLSYHARHRGRGNDSVRREQYLPRLKSQPLHPGDSSLVEFAALRQAYNAKRDHQQEALRQKLKAEREQLRGQQRQRRETILAGDWRGMGDAKNAMASVLAAEQAAERAEMADRHDQERKRLGEELPPFPNYEEWLRAQGKEREADEWRARLSRAHANEVNGFAPPSDTEYVPPIPPKDIRAFRPQVRDENSVVYTRQDEQIPAFTDKGTQIDMHDTGDDSTLAGLQLGQAKWGKVTITGDSDFKAKCVSLAVANGITVANPELQGLVEAERQRLVANVFPADPRPEPTTKAELETRREEIMHEIDSVTKIMEGKSMEEYQDATRGLLSRLHEIDVELDRVESQEHAQEEATKAKPEPVSEVERLERQREAKILEMEALAAKGLPMTELMAENRRLSQETTRLEVEIEAAQAREAQAEQDRQRQIQLDQVRQQIQSQQIPAGQTIQGQFGQQPSQYGDGKMYWPIKANDGRQYLIPSHPGMETFAGKNISVINNGGKFSFNAKQQSNSLTKGNTKVNEPDYGPSM
jgi:hypothetical protein